MRRTSGSCIRAEASARRHPGQPLSTPRDGETDLDALSLLRLQIEWGADEALQDAPVDRRLVAPERPAAPAAAPVVQLPVAPSIPAIAPGRGQVAAAQEAAAAAGDIAALRQAIAAFEGCGLRDTATHLVFAEGDASTGLVVVGEVPDAEEDRAGHPFAGRPGQLLDRMLDSIGLDRRGLLLTTLIPWRPAGDRPPSSFELSVCLPFLERLLVLAQPTHLLLMGSRPAKLLAGSTIRAGAGWQRPTMAGLPEQARALAMRHPAYLLSHLPARREAWADLLLLRTTRDATRQITDA